MSLKTTVDKIAQKALRVFKDFRKEVTYETLTGSGTYDPVTDRVTQRSTKYTILGLFLKYTENVREPSYSATGTYTGADVSDQKAFFLFAAKDVVDTFDPEPGDLMKVTENGQTWRVVSTASPPGSAIYKLEVIRVS